MKTWPFHRGQTYNRRRDIHAVYGGQQQGGIITPQEAPMVILVTGKIGQNHRYVDTWRDDGMFEYTGEGQIGDQTLTRGNAAIADHSRVGKDLLLFTKLGGGSLRYEGEWVCASVQEEQRQDRNGTDRVIFVFLLCRLDELVGQTDGDSAGDRSVSLEELRRRALAAATDEPPRRDALRSVIRRSRDVRSYVLARAAGSCEGCREKGPFARLDGSLYLEPHHIRRVSDGGPDHPAHVIAVCPNCHRRVHFGADGGAYNSHLATRMLEIERE